MGSKASEFGHLSGLYSMELIVGDAVLSNSFSWKVADVVLKFSDSLPAPSPAKDQYLYAPKPEIKVCIFKLSLHILLYRKNRNLARENKKIGQSEPVIGERR
jgi:hypothetical protein